MSAFQAGFCLEVWYNDLMKTCFKCQQEKSTSHFAKNVSRADGLNSQCRECQKEYRQDHYDKNKQKYIDKATKWGNDEKIKFYTWLSQYACMDCGNPNFVTFHFDHKYDKNFQISEKIGVLSFDAIMDEVSKCDIVCANCHAIRTADRGNYYSYLQACVV